MKTFASPWNGEHDASSSDQGLVAGKSSLQAPSTGTDRSVPDCGSSLPRVQGCDGHAGQTLAPACTTGI